MSEQRLFIGITQSLMFCGHEWRDEERRLNKNDRCREDPENADSRHSDDMRFAHLDCIDLLDPELLSEEYEAEPHLVIVMERMKIDRDDIKARRLRIEKNGTPMRNRE